MKIVLTEQQKDFIKSDSDISFYGGCIFTGKTTTLLEGSKKFYDPLMIGNTRSVRLCDYELDFISLDRIKKGLFEIKRKPDVVLIDNVENLSWDDMVNLLEMFKGVPFKCTYSLHKDVEWLSRLVSARNVDYTIVEGFHSDFNEGVSVSVFPAYTQDFLGIMKEHEGFAEALLSLPKNMLCKMVYG